jgi:hypothetical protein
MRKPGGSTPVRFPVATATYHRYEFEKGDFSCNSIAIQTARAERFLKIP